VENGKEYDKGVAPLPSESEPQEKRESEKPKSQRPFPLSLVCPLFHSHKGVQKLHINVPFLDALSQMPLYAKFLK